FFTATSLIAIVPLNEFSTPTLMPFVAAETVVGAVVGLAAGAAVGAVGGVLVQAASRPPAPASVAAPIARRKNRRRDAFPVGTDWAMVKLTSHKELTGTAVACPHF